MRPCIGIVLKEKSAKYILKRMPPAACRATRWPVSTRLALGFDSELLVRWSSTRNPNYSSVRQFPDRLCAERLDELTADPPIPFSHWRGMPHDTVQNERIAFAIHQCDCYGCVNRKAYAGAKAKAVFGQVF